MIVWPVALPSTPLYDGYKESFPNLLKRTSPDQGVGKQRRKCANRPWPMSASFRFTSDEYEEFVGFCRDTLSGGAYRFTFRHPRLLTDIEMRIVPQGDALFGAVPSGFDSWDVDLSLEVLP